LNLAPCLESHTPRCLTQGLAPCQLLCPKETQRTAKPGLPVWARQGVTSAAFAEPVPSLQTPGVSLSARTSAAGFSAELPDRALFGCQELCTPVSLTAEAMPAVLAPNAELQTSERAAEYPLNHKLVSSSYCSLSFSRDVC